MFRNLLAAAALSLGAASAQALPAYMPVGPQDDVAVSTVLSGGWTVIHSEAYGADGTTMAELFDGAQDWIILAGREVDSPVFDVLAAVRADVFLPLHTAVDATLNSNGSEWYKNAQSLGFAPGGAVITQTSADTTDFSDPLRLSWHTDPAPGGDSSADPAATLHGGWRSGATTGLNSSTTWERVVLTAADAPAVPLPAALPLFGAALASLGLLAARRRSA